MYLSLPIKHTGTHKLAFTPDKMNSDRQIHQSLLHLDTAQCKLQLVENYPLQARLYIHKSFIICVRSEPLLMMRCSRQDCSKWCLCANVVNSSPFQAYTSLCKCAGNFAHQQYYGPHLKAGFKKYC